MSAVVALTRGAIAERNAGALDGYIESLRAACDGSPPPFGMRWYGERYRSLATDRDWLAASLVANAKKEGEGSRDLWALAGRTEHRAVAEQIRRHAIDESRHVLLYLSILELVFPEAVSADARPVLREELSPGYTVRDPCPTASLATPCEVLDCVVQINLGEIRTRINQLLLTPVITAWCPVGRRRTLSGLLASLMRDETRHIRYTADLIDQAITEADGDFVRAVMAQRLDEFNHITLREVGARNYIGS
jgi:hypothetical protein